MPRYTEEQFLDVSEEALPKFSFSLTRPIGASVWKYVGDMRDVISIGKLVKKSDGPIEVERMINTMRKYGVDGK